MTPNELYKAYQTLSDSAGQSYLTAPRFLRLYWICAIDWLKELARQPSSELERRGMGPYKRTWSSSGRRIDYSGIPESLLAIRSVRADFDSDRKGMGVTPVDSDSLATRQQDPFRKGTDDDPIYAEEDNTGLDIYSTTPPLRVVISYVTFPVLLDKASEKGPPEAIDAQWAIIRRVVAEKDLIDEKYNRYQLLAGRVIPQAEQTT